MSLRSWMLAGVALTLSSAAFAQTGVAPAAPATPVADDAPGDIVVTAQKRSERLQDVPLAVSVVTGDALAAQGKVSLEGAQYLVPTLNFLKSGTTLNQSLFLRGVGTATFSIAGEPSVSTVLDGVVFSRSGEAFSDLVDIERLEVLRGPQGTLFGKNASAGVINIVSVKPGDKLGGYVEGGFFGGNGNEYRVRGAIDVPFSDKIRSRLTGFYDKYDGNIFNVAPNVNRRVNGLKHYGFRGIVEADPTDTVKLTFIADYHKNNDDCCARSSRRAPRPLLSTGAVNTTQAALLNTVLPTFRGASAADDRPEPRHPHRRDRLRLLAAGRYRRRAGDVHLDHRLSQLFEHRNPRRRLAAAGVCRHPQLHDFGPQTGDTWSQEFRLTSPAKGFLTYVAGFYFSNAKSERIFTRSDIDLRRRPRAGRARRRPHRRAPARSRHHRLSRPAPPTSARTSATSRCSASRRCTSAPRFRLIGGARFSCRPARRVPQPGHDARRAPGIGGNFDAGVKPPISGSSARASRRQRRPPGGRVVERHPVPRAREQYQHLGQGGRAVRRQRHQRRLRDLFARLQGARVQHLLQPVVTGTNRIAPEDSDAFEVGLKNTLLGGKLTLNLAAYYAKYHNFQANNPDVVERRRHHPLHQRRRNLDPRRRADLLYRPVRDLSISGGVAYTDAHVDAFQIPRATTPASSRRGTPLGFAPKWKGDLGVDYRLRTGGAVDFDLGAQGSYQSSELSLFVADPVQRAAGTIGAYGLVNLTAAVLDNKDRYRLTFTVRNVTNEHFAAAIANGGVLRRRTATRSRATPTAITA